MAVFINIMMMLHLIMLHLVPLASALQCLPNQRGPLQTDCDELIAILRERSFRPPYKNVKRWGREEEDTPTSVSLPKNFYIFRPESMRQSTCIIRMDAQERPGVPNYEDFKLQRVVGSAIAIYTACISQGAPGIIFPGTNGVVWVKVERVALPPPPPELYNVTSNGTAELRIFGGEITSLNAHITWVS